MAKRHKKNMMMMSIVMMRTTTTSFVGFLFRELEGQRLWVGIAAILTLVQVTADLLLPFPFKLILDKLVNHKNPNIPFMEGLLSFFDQAGSATHLQPGELHTQLAVILFSTCLLVLLSLVNASATYV